MFNCVECFLIICISVWWDGRKHGSAWTPTVSSVWWKGTAARGVNRMMMVKRQSLTHRRSQLIPRAKKTPCLFPETLTRHRQGKYISILHSGRYWQRYRCDSYTPELDVDEERKVPHREPRGRLFGRGHRAATKVSEIRQRWTCHHLSEIVFANFYITVIT